MKAAGPSRRVTRVVESLEPRRLLASIANKVADINQATGFLAPNNFTSVGLQTYFVAKPYQGDGEELWRTDGTDAGTVKVAAAGAITDIASISAAKSGALTFVGTGSDGADAFGNLNARQTALAFTVLPGDADNDHDIDFDDLLILAKNFNATGTSFSQGDYDTAGAVGFDDLLLLAKAFHTNLGIAPPGSFTGAVPIMRKRKTSDGLA